MFVTIMRGLPGSGKSTFAKRLADKEPKSIIVSADEYFVDANGIYRFDPSKIGEAHAYCLRRYIRGLLAGEIHVIVDNTNTQIWEFRHYIDLAKAFGYEIEITPMHESGRKLSRSYLYTIADRCTHGVPYHVIERMADRWEDFLPGE